MFIHYYLFKNIDNCNHNTHKLNKDHIQLIIFHLPLPWMQDTVLKEK